MPHTLLTLPPELRNKIYTHYFQHPQTSQPAYNLRPLTMVNRQLRSETLALYHREVQFPVLSPKAAQRFLRTYRPVLYTGITQLRVEYSTYGAPRLAKDVVWQEKHTAAWTRACKALAKTLPSLRALHLHVFLASMAPKFNLRQAWILPLLQFRRLEALEHVTVLLRSTLFPGSRCRLTGMWPARSRIIVKELHDLFGDAVAKAVMGQREGQAMREFRERWEVERMFWGHILQFAETGW